MKFSKDFKKPDPIPEKSISRAVELMKTGQLYRYSVLNDESDDQLGTEVAKFESEFSSYTGHKYAIAVNSCGSAIFLALKALGVENEDKVLTNSFTFTAVPSSIVHAGGIPVYVECNSEYIIDLDDLKDKIQANPDVKYFVLSHMRGHISDLDRIKDICDQAGIYLIEDCAHSLGAEWNGKLVGHHAQVACFSSQSYKLLNSGEGGVIATNNHKVAAYCILAAGSYENLYEKHINRPSDNDLFEKLKFTVPNFSLRMSNLTAVVLREQLKSLNEKVSQHRVKYDLLAEILSSAININLPSPLPEVMRAPNSLQFNLIGLTPKQVDEFVQQTAQRGVKIQIFGAKDNARYYKNWQYSFQEIPNLEKTDSIISFAADLRISLSFDTNDLNRIGYIIKDVLYKINSETNLKDYPGGLTDHFQNTEEIQTKYDTWVASYDREHHDNGWMILLNRVAYILNSHFKNDDLILDIGCGTGLFGRELSSYGFRNIQGLDLSQKSLEISSKLNLYQDLHQAELGKTLDFADNTFDALVSTGVFTRNQIPLNAFEELIRILKPGGIFGVVFRVEDNDFYYHRIKDYCQEKILQEIFKERISVLKSCNHELVIVQHL